MSYYRFCVENIIMNLCSPLVLKYVHIILEIYNPFLSNTELSHHV